MPSHRANSANLPGGIESVGSSCDGDSISAQAWWAISTRAGGEVVSADSY
jgi:hypothetical protein